MHINRILIELALEDIQGGFDEKSTINIPLLPIFRLKWPNQIKDETFSISLIRDYSSSFDRDWLIKIVIINDLIHGGREVFNFPIESFFNDQLDFSSKELSAGLAAEILYYIISNLMIVDKDYLNIFVKKEFIESNEDLKRSLSNRCDEQLDYEEKKKKFLYECIGRLSEHMASKIDLEEMVVRSLKKKESFDEISDSMWGSLVRKYDPDSIINEIFLNDVESEVLEIFTSLSKEEKFSLWVKYFGAEDLLSEWMGAGQIPSSFGDVNFSDLHLFLDEISKCVVGYLTKEADEEYYRRLNATG